jgi:DNA-binding winged helix-turn-helix (wHTH) protein
MLAEAGKSLQLDGLVGDRLKFGEFELAPVARILWRRDERVKLGSRALDILITLASRPGQILSKDELTQLVWRGPTNDKRRRRVVSAARATMTSSRPTILTS